MVFTFDEERDRVSVVSVDVLDVEEVAARVSRTHLLDHQSRDVAVVAFRVSHHLFRQVAARQILIFFFRSKI